MYINLLTQDNPKALAGVYTGAIQAILSFQMYLNQTFLSVQIHK